jgi:NAD(P)-dependent dehydrogenase (short-subunit alcohol dehydrogenase family)
MSWLEAPVCIVTGAAGGIGAAIVNRLLQMQMAVVAVDLQTEAITRAIGRDFDTSRLFPFAADLSSPESWKEIVAHCQKSLGGVNILINNAGVIIRQSIENSNPENWDKQMDVNLKASYFLSKLCAEEMRKVGWGRIINMSSQAAQTGGAEDCPIYAISKGGINTMTRGFARMYGKHGITVNAISPGIVLTDMIKKTLTEDRINAITGQIPIGRVTEASEIAAAVQYLCSEEAGSVTGQVLHISGGMVMR